MIGAIIATATIRATTLSQPRDVTGSHSSSSNMWPLRRSADGAAEERGEPVGVGCAGRAGLLVPERTPLAPQRRVDALLRGGEAVDGQLRIEIARLPCRGREIPGVHEVVHRAQRDEE